MDNNDGGWEIPFRGFAGEVDGFGLHGQGNSQSDGGDGQMQAQMQMGYGERGYFGDGSHMWPPHRLPSDNRHPAYSFADYHAPPMMPDTATAALFSPNQSASDHSAIGTPVESPDVKYAELVRRPSNGGRALVPNLQPTTASAAQETGPSGGPTSKAHVIPARPKPGRKPATDVPASGRRSQNRDSQRNFRLRKVNAENFLKARIMALEEQRKADKSELLAEIARLHEQLRTANDDVRMATQQATYYQHEYEKLRDDNTPAAVPQRLQSSFNGHRSVRTMDPYFDARAETVPDAAFRAASSQCDDCQPSNCRCVDEMTNAAAYAVGQPAPVDAVPLPPRRVPSPMAGVVRGHDAGAAEDVDFSAREFDFTPPTAFMSSTDTPTACGLCIDNPDLCFCKHESLEPGDDDTKPSMAMTGPGSCADCQSNPQQKAWCQRVAQLRAEATPPNSRRTSLEIMKPKAATGIDLSRAGASPVAGDATVGCSDAFKLLQGRVSTDPNGIMDWRHLKPVSHIFAQQGFTMEPGRYSAMELDASSILTTLQHATCPLQPRSSDGAHARLVQEAEERRRASFSPVAHTEDHMMGRALSRFNLGG